MLDAAIDSPSTHPPAAASSCSATSTAASWSPDRDLDWHELMAAAPSRSTRCRSRQPTRCTSSTPRARPGKPKGVVRDNGGHAVALLWTMRNIYDIAPGDVFWAASDVGWVVGHSYIVYAPLLAGATTVLYEGKPVGTPDAGAFWRVASEHGVKALFTAPTAIRAIRRRTPTARTSPSTTCRRCGTCSWPASGWTPTPTHWASEQLGIPVIDHWWQTETGWPIAANPMGVEPMPIKPGSPTVPMPGYDVRILRPDGSGCAPGEEGAICIRLPLPPGTLPTLWGDDDRYVASYLSEHPGYYLTGDGGYVDEDGYLYVMGRIDDVINVAGHRLSTGSMEAVLAAHPAVAECAVIGVADEIKGQVPRGLVVLKAGASADGLAERAGGRRARRDRRGGVLQDWSTSYRRCRRRARARSCERPCAASPMARTSRCRRPSRTRQCSMR